MTRFTTEKSPQSVMASGASLGWGGYWIPDSRSVRPTA